MAVERTVRETCLTSRLKYNDLLVVATQNDAIVTFGMELSIILTIRYTDNHPTNAYFFYMGLIIWSVDQHQLNPRIPV